MFRDSEEDILTSAAVSVPHLASQTSWMGHPELQMCLVEEATPLYSR